jgi:predicted RNA-binding protein with TRAM domain
MVDPILVAAGLAVAAVAAYGGYQKGRADGMEAGRAAAEEAASQRAHEDATERAPPVDVGDHVSLGVKEFKQHHSGDRVAVCKKKGFVVFVENVPDGVEVGDVIDAEVVSFGPDNNSAEATYTGD